MTPAQSKRYWRDWGRIRKMLVEQGEYSKEDADAQRMEIHREALGVEKSSKALTNRDLDKVFKAFASYLVLIDGPRDLDADDQPRKRLIYAIEQLGLDEPYLQTISFDQFKTPYWRTLSEAQLTHFRFTATARAAALKKNGK